MSNRARVGGEAPSLFHASFIWLAMGLICAAPSYAQTPVVEVIDASGDVGNGTAVTVVGGNIAVSYIDNATQRLRLWYDDGAGGGTAGDRMANGAEIRVIDSSGTTYAGGSKGTGITSISGNLAISYYDGVNGDLVLWYDDGNGGGTPGDGNANGSEIRIIDSSGTVGSEPSISVFAGRLVIAYADSTNTALKIWYDDGDGGGTADDGIANGTEIRTIDAGPDVGATSSITVVNSRLAVSYLDFGNYDMKLWIDDGVGGGTAGDLMANGTEIRTIDSTNDTGGESSMTTLNNRVAISYYDYDDGALRLWYDDGNGGGMAGDGVNNGSERRTIAAGSISAGIGYYSSITTFHGRLAISYLNGVTGALDLWYDDGDGGGTVGDAASNGTEIREMDDTITAGTYGALTSYDDALIISYSNWTTFDLRISTLTNATPAAPGSLGATAYVNGAIGADTTPTLQFNQSDGNTGDTLAFQIQIDDTSDFSSPVVDYTSASVAQGANSFTVGQTAGSGSYSVGAASQTLAIGSYYWRVRSTDYIGDGAWATANGGSVAFIIGAIPTLTTTAASAISSSTAISGGNVTTDGGASVSARGVCWSTSHNPTTSESHTTNGSGTGSFTSSLTTLAPGTLYYVRAYATNTLGTSYGNEVSLTTLPTTPTVTTGAASAIEDDSANCSGTVTADGGAAVTERGVCWSTSAGPTVASNHTASGTGTGNYTGSLTGLSRATLYHVRAYAINSVGTSYGGEITFTTAAVLPTVTTTDASAITATSATSGGDVADDGGADVTTRGVCWSTSHDPTTDDAHTTDGVGDGVFSSDITDLLPATTYFVRAYAVNSAGTGFGEEFEFTTSGPPTEPMPDLHLTVTPSMASATVGDSIVFDIEVKNAGDADAESLEFSIMIPEVTEYISAQWTPEAEVARATVPTTLVAEGIATIGEIQLAAGDTGHLELELKTIAAGTIELTVMAAASDAAISVTAESETPVVVTAATDPSTTTSFPICGTGAGVATMVSLLFIAPLARTLTRRKR